MKSAGRRLKGRLSRGRERRSRGSVPRRAQNRMKLEGKARKLWARRHPTSNLVQRRLRLPGPQSRGILLENKTRRGSFPLSKVSPAEQIDPFTALGLGAPTQAAVTVEGEWNARLLPSSTNSSSFTPYTYEKRCSSRTTLSRGSSNPSNPHLAPFGSQPKHQDQTTPPRHGVGGKLVKQEKVGSQRRLAVWAAAVLGGVRVPAAELPPPPPPPGPTSIKATREWPESGMLIRSRWWKRRKVVERDREKASVVFVGRSEGEEEEKQKWRGASCPLTTSADIGSFAIHSARSQFTPDPSTAPNHHPCMLPRVCAGALSTRVTPGHAWPPAGKLSRKLANPHLSLATLSYDFSASNYPHLPDPAPFPPPSRPPPSPSRQRELPTSTPSPPFPPTPRGACLPASDRISWSVGLLRVRTTATRVGSSEVAAE